jgi:hypothetical protein
MKANLHAPFSRNQIETGIEEAITLHISKDINTA